MDGGTWEATVHGVAESQTRLSDFTFIFFLSSSESLLTLVTIRGVPTPQGINRVCVCVCV